MNIAAEACECRWVCSKKMRDFAVLVSLSRPIRSRLCLARTLSSPVASGFVQGMRR